MQLTQVVGSNILPMARMQNFSHHLSRIRKSWSAPTISIYEVFKRVFQQRGEGDALQAIAVMAQGKTVELSLEVAVSAANQGMGQATLEIGDVAATALITLACPALESQTELPLPAIRH